MGEGMVGAKQTICWCTKHIIWQNGQKAGLAMAVAAILTAIAG